ncbi:MAG: ATP-dependent DNA helicase RecG [Planctomycetes bacterium]|nr:ATP-dependent DNA helicase RecG [Planctomycetota bacterium]
MGDPNTAPDSTAASPSITLATPIQYAPLVGPKRAELFARLGVHTVADLIKHLPHRYEFQAGQKPIEQLLIGAIGTATGVVANCRWQPGRRANGGRFIAMLEDGTGTVELVFFNAPYLRDRVHPETKMIVTGKVVVYNDQRQMVNPSMRIIYDDNVDEPAPTEDRYRPIYPATEDLSSVQIDRIVRGVLPIALPQIDDHFDEAYRQPRGLPTLRETYRMLHAPAGEDEVKSARRRLAYDELLFLQLGFSIKRKYTQTELHAVALRYSDAIDRHIRERFPFPLTPAQDKVVRQIARDLERDRPMNRLLQGDVGSGKTVVALYAMLMAVASNTQGALMAPTELLAEQHFLSITNMLRGSTVRLALLTGSQTKAERTAMLHQIETGDIDIVVGTQALLSESVQFADLAVAIIDEQHRFGVMQRAVFRTKVGDLKATPHTLVMTATPIPRTLSLTIFGDLDTSVIDELPPGRQPIITRVVEPRTTDEVYRYIAGRIAGGEQAYIVVPAIDESDAGLKAVRTHAAELEKTYFADRRVAPLHGQLKPAARERIMQKFRDGRIDVLVATTVIEVGVDVPNASIMVVEHAERFGLAQLHQLRGRVGRGSRKSLCVFIGDPTTEDAQQRLAAIAKTTNGFEIAEADLVIRGMGEFFGTRQAGLPPLQVADLSLHMDLLQLARRDAQAIVDSDPKLKEPAHDLLRKRLVKQYGEALGLGDVA